MLRNKMISIAIASAIALASAGAALASNEKEGHENASEIAAVLAATISPAQAIAAAEQASGGRAMKVDLRRDKGRDVYAVKTVVQDKIVKVFVDPATGQVVKTEDDGLIARVFDREDRDEATKLVASPVTLAAAIATAEQQTGGKSIEAAFENENGAAQFEIEVVKDNTVHTVKIDATNGQVLKVAAANGSERQTFAAKSDTNATAGRLNIQDPAYQGYLRWNGFPVASAAIRSDVNRGAEGRAGSETGRGNAADNPSYQTYVRWNGFPVAAAADQSGASQGAQSRAGNEAATGSRDIRDDAAYQTYRHWNGFR